MKLNPENDHSSIRSVVTGEDGAFVFEDAPSTETGHRLEVHDAAWRGWTSGVRVGVGEETAEVELLVLPAPKVVGTVTFGGRPPGEHRILALVDVPARSDIERQFLGIGGCDASGAFEVVARRSWRGILVPKRSATPSDGGYRRFAAEFMETPTDPSPWEVHIPTVNMDFPRSW